jgi:hypothetical protein
MELNDADLAEETQLMAIQAPETVKRGNDGVAPNLSAFCLDITFKPEELIDIFVNVRNPVSQGIVLSLISQNEMEKKYQK